jgi:hypothetical protein
MGYKNIEKSAGFVGVVWWARDFFMYALARTFLNKI